MTQPDAVAALLAELDRRHPRGGAGRRRRALRRPRGVRLVARRRGPGPYAHDRRRPGLDIPIFTLDTGRLFPETYDLLDRTAKHYDLCIKTYFPAAAEVEKMVDEDGVNLFRDSIEARHRCCEVRKILPLRRAQLELGAWICGLRSGQGATRQKVEIAEWDQARRHRQDQPARRLGRGACGSTSARTTCRTTRSTTRAILDRLRALHARGGRGRGLARGAVVVGAARAQGVRLARRAARIRQRSRHGRGHRRGRIMNQLDTTGSARASTSCARRTASSRASACSGRSARTAPCCCGWRARRSSATCRFRWCTSTRTTRSRR